MSLATPSISKKARSVKWRADFPFTFKLVSEESGDLELNGYASTWVKDRDDEWVDPDAYATSLDNYLSKNPMVLYQHNMEWPVGTCQNAHTDEFGLIIDDLVAKPHDKEVPEIHTCYEKTRRGILRTLSVGGFFQRDFMNGRDVIREIELMEHSIVSIPSNPDSIFEAAAKALGHSSARPQLSAKHFAQMQQLLGMESITDPELVGMSDGEKIERHGYLVRSFMKAGLRAPAYDDYREIAEKVMGSKGRDVLAPSQQMIAVVQKAKGYAPIGKRGRVLSARNEEELRRLNAIFDTAEAQLDEIGDAARHIISEAKSSLALVLKQVEEGDGEGDETGEEEGNEEDGDTED